MEIVAASLAAHLADDVIGSGFEMVRVQPAHPPGAALGRLSAHKQILLHPQFAANHPAARFRADPLRRLTGTVLKDSR